LKASFSLLPFSLWSYPLCHCNYYSFINNSYFILSSPNLESDKVLPATIWDTGEVRQKRKKSQQKMHYQCDHFCRQLVLESSRASEKLY
jgi:hypothetical protein